MSNFQEIEALLSELLLAATPLLSDAEHVEIQRFIDVGEYGLALETAAYIYSEEKKLATEAVLGLIKRLAVVMSIDPVPLLSGISKE